VNKTKALLLIQSNVFLCFDTLYQNKRSAKLNIFKKTRSESLIILLNYIFKIFLEFLKLF